MIGPISFATPAILAGLILLPALYFLLRATPPAPRRQVFPPLRLLRDILPTERSPVRMPIWLLLLRLLAAALVIIGFAGPQIVPPRLLPGTGPILLVIDNSWAAAPDFSARIAAARRIVDQAGHRGVILLATAGTAAGRQPQASGVLARTGALAALGALHAEPWPADRAQDTAAVRAVRRHNHDITGVYLADALAAPGLNRFVAALDPAWIITNGAKSIRLLYPPGLAPDGALIARLGVVAQPAAILQPVLAEAASGAALARVVVRVSPGATHGEARFDLPVALAAQVARLALPGAAAPGGIALLDGATRLVTVGLASGGTANPEQRLLGTLYYVRRALPVGTLVRTGRVDQLIAAGVSAIIMADLPLDPGEIGRLRRFMAAGGVVIRFAGPLTAPQPDALTPDTLMRGVRELGSALAAGKPERIAAFDRDSPLAGLALPDHATVSRQILADPATLDPATVWARLSDGTPIVLGARQGRGALVSVLTTANAAWSNWPIAADFPALIDRLVHLGLGSAPKSGLLRPLRVLNGAGALVVPGAAARSLAAGDFITTMVSPLHPPGLWGNAHGVVALNIGDHVPVPAAAAFPATVPVMGLDAVPRARRFGPPVLALALAILIADGLISLLLRGALRWRAGVAALLLLGLAPRAHAAPPPGALAPMLAYVRTGDARIDAVSRAGLGAISDLVNQETAARLAAPRGVTPGADNLNFYPLLYWPITAATRPPDPSACRALDAFMAGGGLLVIDTDGGGAELAGSGAGFDPGAGAALRKATACLAIPPLETLTDRDTLAHTFFLARHFPGRFDGAPVFIAAKGGRDADGVSPVVIGSNDWAGAWAVDGAGMPMRALLPGAPGQRQDADWFGVNLVMYALTGTYKSDQVQIPAILRRLAQ
ncbi:DUF4159 domain-containing protein [Acidiphilium sp.]|uniref:DUF4159 domain-containing protein n=1 Tax=Acidiphilium sp. TaxID=527 RepID=UPI003D059340